MRYSSWSRTDTGAQEPRFDPYNPPETDPPEPLQIFTRLGLLLTIALGFGLAAELLSRLPPG
jgi:hypothetical protein